MTLLWLLISVKSCQAASHVSITETYSVSIVREYSHIRILMMELEVLSGVLVNLSSQLQLSA
jgi:hypothetical protein